MLGLTPAGGSGCQALVHSVHVRIGLLVKRMGDLPTAPSYTHRYTDGTDGTDGSLLHPAHCTGHGYAGFTQNKKGNDAML